MSKLPQPQLLASFCSASHQCLTLSLMFSYHKCPPSFSLPQYNLPLGQISWVLCPHLCTGFCLFPPLSSFRQRVGSFPFQSDYQVPHIKQECWLVGGRAEMMMMWIKNNAPLPSTRSPVSLPPQMKLFDYLFFLPSHIPVNPWITQCCFCAHFLLCWVQLHQEHQPYFLDAFQSLPNENSCSVGSSKWIPATLSLRAWLSWHYDLASLSLFLTTILPGLLLFCSLLFTDESRYLLSISPLPHFQNSLGERIHLPHFNYHIYIFTQILISKISNTHTF